MNRGGKFLVSTAILAVAACGGQDGKLEIRSTPTPLAQGKQPVPYRIAEARGQLALGNVALALESFRIAAREDPDSVDALVGIATCYDQMRRYDLSGRNYEAALALAPSNVEILGALAASFQLQGRTAEALSVRQEIAARSAASAAETMASAAPAPVAVERASETLSPMTAMPVRVAALEAKPAPVVAPIRAPEPAPVTAHPVVAAAATPVAPTAKPAPQVETKVAAGIAPKPTPAAVQPSRTAALGPSVTIKLPSARPVQPAPMPAAAAKKAEAPKAAPAAPAPAPAPMPIDVPVELASLAPAHPSSRPRIHEPAVVEERGPRLERISMGEIALITQTAKPVWVSTTVARSERSTTLRFVPLRQASMSPVKVRLLNAARVNRLAARTRTWLTARGWKGLSIGNANATRARSVILYPAEKRLFAQRLSAQFGFPLARRASGSHVTVLLGADALRHRAVRPGRA